MNLASDDISSALTKRCSWDANPIVLPSAMSLLNMDECKITKLPQQRLETISYATEKEDPKQVQGTSLEMRTIDQKR